MNSTTNMTFTAIDELPLPPTWMLEELEEEYKKYNTFLLQQIFTIKECRPIRNAFRSKMNRTPSAIAIHKALENPKVKHYKNNITRLQSIENRIRLKQTKSEYNNSLHIMEVMDYYVNKEVKDIMMKKNSRGLQFKAGIYKLAEKINELWCNEVNYGLRYNCDKVLRCGFQKWFMHNLRKFEKRRNNKKKLVHWAEVETPKY